MFVSIPTHLHDCILLMLLRTDHGHPVKYYNLRPHTALNGKTPAQKAKIDDDSRQNWLSLIKKATGYSATNLSKGVDRK